MTTSAGGWPAAWQRLPRRRRAGILLLLALALLVAAGATWAVSNPGLQSYRPAQAVVVDSSAGDPSTITVRYTTADDQDVEATTDRLTWVPPAGAPIAIRYDPADPDQVVMDGYSAPNLLSTALVGLFAVALGGVWLTLRRRGTAEPDRPRP